MMIKSAKREIFFLIIEEWFDDSSEDINNENYVSFYVHFLGALGFEYRHINFFDPDFKKFIGQIIIHLSSLETHVKIPGFDENSEFKEKILEIYKNAKEEFFLP